MNKQIIFTPKGADAVLITFGQEIQEVTNQEIRRFLTAMEKRPFPGVLDKIPSYCHITIQYDPEACYYEEILDYLYTLTEEMRDSEQMEARLVRIPVLYGGTFGPDLQNVASHNGLTKEEVVKIHSEGKYLTYMLGFTPGFPYLGGMSEKIATPRLQEPREKIWAGAVGIAGSQTGIYPIESPGGWQIIGRTPLRLFDPDRNPVFLLQAGDYIQFYPIDQKTYLELGGESHE